MTRYSLVAVLFCILSNVLATGSSARLLPRNDLANGVGFGIEPNSAGVTFTQGLVSVGLDVAKFSVPAMTTYRIVNFFDPALSFAITPLASSNFRLGLAGQIETYTDVARIPAPQVALNVHNFAGELGFSASFFHNFELANHQLIRLYIDPYLPFTLDSDKSIMVSRNIGCEAGIVFNDGLDLMFSNSPLLQFTVVGVRGHL